MNSLLIAAVVLACCLAGIGAGVLIRRSLPEHHLSPEPKDVIKQGFGLIATMVALVLGLLVASAKTAFDAENASFAQMSTNLIVLDRTLNQYGPEAKPARELLRRSVASMVNRLWPDQSTAAAGSVDSREITSDAEAFYAAIRKLSPKDDFQRSVQSQAIQTCGEFAKTRWSMSQPAPPLLPAPFLVVLAFWIAVLFASYGLLTPPNRTVLETMGLCALSLSGAIFLIVDLGEPLGGLIRISDASLRYGLSQLGQ
ncbi:MAG TPA: hypothetical protein VGH33_00790 [Isosphaeraceae bacterium]